MMAVSKLALCMWTALVLNACRGGMAAGPSGGQTAFDGNLNHSRYAFATLYHEGIAAETNAENLLSLRVLLDSMKPIEYPFVVLAANTVAERSLQVLRDSGATVVMYTELQSPYGAVIAELNKLYLWTLMEYERVIFIDAFSNVAVHPRALEDLFLCGEFCAVFAAPCRLATGLLVIKPDTNVFERLQKELSFASDASSDEALLSHAFPDCALAPMFNPEHGPSQAAINQIPMGYNVPALQLLLRGHVDYYRCGRFQFMDGLPVATLKYPPSLVSRPVFWYNSFLGHTDEWEQHQARLSQLGLPVSVILHFYLVFLVTALTNAALVGKAARRELQHRQLYRWVTIPLANLGSAGAVALCSCVSIATGLGLGLLLTPLWWPRIAAVTFFVFIQGCSLLITGRYIGSAVLRLRFPQEGDTTPMPLTVWQCVLPAASWAVFWLGSLRAAAIAPFLGRRIDAAFVGLTLSIVVIVLAHTGLFSRLCAASRIFAPLLPPGNTRTKAKTSNFYSHSRSSSLTNFMNLDRDLGGKR